MFHDYQDKQQEISADEIDQITAKIQLGRLDESSSARKLCARGTMVSAKLLESFRPKYVYEWLKRSKSATDCQLYRQSSNRTGAFISDDALVSFLSHSVCAWLKLFLTGTLSQPH